MAKVTRVDNFQLQGMAALDYAKAEAAVLKDFPAQNFEFETTRTHEQKLAAFASSYGKAAPANWIIVIRVDDTQGQRHGGMRQYRHFDVYVNGHKVQTFNDGDAATGYYSGERLDSRIERWLTVWETALGCKALRGELKGRVKLIK